MPYKEKPITRRYWSVPLIARELNTTPSRIWFWVKQFDLPIYGKKPLDLEQRATIHEIYRLRVIENYNSVGTRCKLKEFEHKKKTVTDY